LSKTPRNIFGTFSVSSCTSPPGKKESKKTPVINLFRSKKNHKPVTIDWGKMDPPEWDRKRVRSETITL